MKLLELFCGYKSVGKAVGNLFNEVVSVDIDSKVNPTIVADILHWDYKAYPPQYFDAIWASPPCQEYSCLNHSHPEKTPNLQWADSVVKRTLEIIEYFKPDRFFIENPQSGLLKDREFMDGIPFYDFDYCSFSDWGYRKRTRIWTSVNGSDRLCTGPGVCTNMVGKRHKNALGNATYQEYWVRGLKRQAQRYAIPPRLIQHLFAL
jgi:site-specific DNA-cytosine methylase